MHDIEMIEVSGFFVVGISTKTSNSLENGPEGRIVPLHQTFINDDISSKIQADDKRLLAVYSDYEDKEKGTYQYLIGYNAQTAEEGLSSVVIPSGKYLRFSSQRGFLSDVLPQAWADIWRMDAEGTLGATRAFGVDFEFHNYEDPGSMDAQVDIYLSIL